MEDPTPAPAGARAAGDGGLDALFWVGLLLMVCAVIVLELQRRRASMRAVSREFPSETVRSDQTPREVAPATAIAGGAKVDALAFAAVELPTEGAIAGGSVHSHKRTRRHPELAGDLDANV